MDIKETSEPGLQSSLRNGFTLVELVVTLVIIGALAAVSAPLFFTKQAFEQSGFFNETLAAVRYAQKLAVASGCTVRVEIAASGYSLFRADDQATCNTPPFGTPVADPSDPGRAFARTAPIGIALSPATNIVFAPLGNADADATVTVGPKSFRVWGVTGFVEPL